MYIPRTALRVAIATAFATLLGFNLHGAEYFVSASAAAGGDGSQSKPFATLAAAETASKDGDTIRLLQVGDKVLDGGIKLKPKQRLIGYVPPAPPLKADALMVPRVTNTTTNLNGVIVELSEANEVAGIEFVNARNHAIHGAGAGVSGTQIHHNRFIGGGTASEIFWAIQFEAETGSVAGVVVTDCVVKDGGRWMGGIQLAHSGDSKGEYRFERNEFSNLGGRAYMPWTNGKSSLHVTILDSKADNIGVGNLNSDSILPRLWGNSSQVVLIKNFHYNNTDQVGSASNCGIEAFIMGAPFTDEPKCVGCKLDLTIEDTVIENAVTDGIQLTNYGTDSTLNVTIRNSKVINANPRQAGGGISLIAQNAQNRGSKSTLSIENTDVIGSKRLGIVVRNEGADSTATVDLGGGSLGSKGGNRIVDSAQGELRAAGTSVSAKNNWWGLNAPRVEVVGDGVKVETEPRLSQDPRPITQAGQ